MYSVPNQATFVAFYRKKCLTRSFCLKSYYKKYSVFLFSFYLIIIDFFYNFTSKYQGFCNLEYLIIQIHLKWKKWSKNSTNIPLLLSYFCTIHLGKLRKNLPLTCSLLHFRLIMGNKNIFVHRNLYLCFKQWYQFWVSLYFHSSFSAFSNPVGNFFTLT